jgi:phosphopantothenoylcysteine decarboxylase / phosphopantothenate---cysteine ligase
MSHSETMNANVLIGVCGGIAAYKVCEVVSSLAKRSDREVRVVISQSATNFISPLTFATLSRHPAHTDADFWQPNQGSPLHIELGEWADLILIAPLTANTLAKLAWGLADNLLTNVVLASDCPILVAPAMNTTMWLQNTVQGNWHNLLKNSRYHPIAPNSGRLACDAVGMGRMAEPPQILASLSSLIWTKGKRDLVGKKILVSAGGTREYLDAVRFLSNPSTGKQGIAIAQAAHDRGAEVILILAGNQLAGKQAINLAENFAFESVNVDTAMEMEAAIYQNFSSSDITIMAAAVGDLRPKFRSDRKLAKSEISLNLELEPTADIVKGLAQIKQNHQLLVGFAAQTGDLAEILKLGQKKLAAKNLDAIVINSVNLDQAETGFASDSNQATFYDRIGQELQTPLCSKLELAHRLFDFLLRS